MRAKTKKDLILQLIIVAIILPFIIWWHPTGPYRVVIKWCAIGLSSLLYFVLNRLWKWKEADEDETPLWYEKKQKQVEDKAKEQKTVESVTALPASQVEEINQRDRHTNRWLVIIFVALAALMVYGIILVSQRQDPKTGDRVYINNEGSAQQPTDNGLKDGIYRYTGEWKGQGIPQECRLEFTIEDGAVKSALYTNVNYNVSIPMLGKVVDKRLIFNDLSGGNNLMLDLSFPYENIAYIEGYGMDYEHENETSQLVLRRVIKPKEE